MSHVDELDVYDLREGSYSLPDGRKVYYVDDSTMRDAADLSSVLDEQYKTGSPNLENLQARHILDRLQTGQGLGEVHVATLRRLLAKHKDKIDALRRSPDRDGQDVLHADASGQGRISKPEGAK